MYNFLQVFTIPCQTKKKHFSMQKYLFQNNLVEAFAQQWDITATG